MTPEQRQELIRLLEQGEEISPEWARILFPPEKREYEVVYHGPEAGPGATWVLSKSSRKGNR